MSDTSGDAQATGGTVADAAAAFEAMLTRDEGDSSGDKALKGRKAKPAPADDEIDDDLPPEDDAHGAGGDDDDEIDDEPGADDESELDEEDDDSEQQPQRKFKVKVNGQELEVTQDELVRGYQREQDYSRKTMELGEARKAHDTEVQAVRQERETYGKLLPQLRSYIENQYGSKELEDLRDTNPGEWAARSQELREQHAATVAEEERLAEAEKKHQADEFAAKRKAEMQTLAEKLPALKDPKYAKALVEYIKGQGASADELEGLVDHRIWLAFDKARRFDALEARRPKAQARAETVKTAQPGGGQRQQSKVTEITRSKQRLAKTGRVQDAAAVFERMLPD
jgi:hypothetical protein